LTIRKIRPTAPGQSRPPLEHCVHDGGFSSHYQSQSNIARKLSKKGEYFDLPLNTITAAFTAPQVLRHFRSIKCTMKRTQV
jgi:hypothetical protein